MDNAREVRVTVKFDRPVSVDSRAVFAGLLADELTGSQGSGFSGQVWGMGRARVVGVQETGRSEAPEPTTLAGESDALALADLLISRLRDIDADYLRHDVAVRATEQYHDDSSDTGSLFWATLSALALALAGEGG